MIGAGFFFAAAILWLLMWHEDEKLKVARYEAQIAHDKAARELRKYLQDHPDTLR